MSSLFGTLPLPDEFILCEYYVKTSKMSPMHALHLMYVMTGIYVYIYICNSISAYMYVYKCI